MNHSNVISMAFLGLALVTASCTSRSSIAPGAKIIRVDTGKGISAINRERLPISDNESLRGAVAVHKVDDTNVLFFMMAGNYCFQYWDCESSEVIGVLRRGNGPGELPDAVFVSGWVGDEGDLYFSAYSMAAGKYYEINLTRTLESGKTSVVRETKLPSTTFYALQAGDITACFVYSINGELSWQLLKDGEIQEKWIPFDTENLNSQENFFAGTAISEDGNLLAMGMVSFPRLFLFNRASGKTLAIAPDMYKDSSVKDALRSKTPSRKQYYNGVAIAGNEVYAMYMNPSPSIQIYDFDGNLHGNFGVPDILVNFIVSGEGIIGITMDGEVLRYSLAR